MYVIMVYDISTLDKEGNKRLARIVKECRQYLHHTQKSVFEGEISEARLMELKHKIGKIIDRNRDYVVIYKLPNRKSLDRENIGLDFDPTDNIL